MQSPNDIIALAANGQVKQIAEALEVSLSRMYELLSRDNPYPKLRRILRPLGLFNPDGLRMVQSDFNAFCASILGECEEHISGATLHKELNEAIQCHLNKAAIADQRREISEAIAVLQKRLLELNRIESLS